MTVTPATTAYLRRMRDRQAEARGDRGPWAPTHLAVAFACVLAMASAWALSVPIFSTPDEHAHVIRAAGLAHGDVLGEGDRVPVVRAPEIFQRSQTFLCYIHEPTTSAECAPPFSGPDRIADVQTLAGRYPPLYYLLVGLPSRPFPSVTGVYLMRLLSAFWMALLVTVALRSLTLLDRPRWLLEGFGVALTPMVVYLGASVNPNGFEIAAALCLWSALLALRERWATPASSGLIHTAGASACALVLCRGLSPLWLALIGAFGLFVLPTEAIRSLIRRRLVVAWAGALIAATAVAVIWIATTGLVPGSGVNLTLTERLRLSTGRVPTFLAQAVGNFGFLDAPAPALTLLLWGLASGALIVLTALVARGRLATVCAASVATALVLPVALEVLQTNAIGLFWQGRYQLPLLVGVPLLAGLAIRDRELDLGLARTRRWVLPALLATAHVAAYSWVVRRYAVGLHGPLLYLIGSAWSPPIPAITLFAVFTAGAVGTSAWTVMRMRATEPSLGSEVVARAT